MPDYEVQRDPVLEEKEISRSMLYKSVFVTEDGKRLLDDLREQFDINALPIQTNINTFGNVDVYLGFVSGGKNVISYIENEINKKEEVDHE